MKKIPLQKSAKRKKEKKDKGEENPSPHLNSTCFLSNFETRSWKVIFPPFFPATWHSESKSIWAKRTQCAKLLAYRAHGSFQFSPSFLLFLPTQSSNPPVESISNVPPFLFLLLLFDSSPFFAPTRYRSVGDIRSRFHGNPTNNGWANALSITRTRKSSSRGGGSTSERARTSISSDWTSLMRGYVK